MPRRFLVTALVLLTLLGVACSSSKSSSSSGSSATSSSSTKTTLKLAFLGDMSVPDPDVFYDIEGNTVILSSYDGLLRYAQDSTKYEPVLASSWDVAPDGLKYTFHLRTGVKFHDGTAFDSAAAKASFQRRVDVGSAPAYMLDAVADTQTPDPSTFVVTLKHPVAPFLDYMASSWGPKMMSPKVLGDHAGDDHAQTWLKTHDAGTGPFTITGFDRGQRYTLKRFDGYWGTKPFFDTVTIDIVPDMNTQRLRLEKGDLDAILHSFPVSEIGGLKSNASLNVQTFTSFLQAYLYVNTNKPPFDKPAVRTAIAQALDVPSIVKEVYGDYGSAAKNMYPGTLLPEGASDFATGFDAGAATAAAKAAGSPKIDFAYTADESGLQQRLGEIIQQRLQSAGFQVSVRQVELPVVYDWANKPTDGADVLLMTNTPDAAHPDTWARIVWGSKGGLNFLGYQSADVDTMLDQAITTTDTTKADATYSQVGTKVAGDVAFIPLANIKDVMILRADLDGLAHIPNYPWTLDLAKLRRK
jgi:peptide/nickel transport system substrate-binding protein